MPTGSEPVQIRLSQSEALVLFEWLAKLDENGGDSTTDEAEQQVLWNVEGQLESILTEVIAEDYRERVTDAKKTILGVQD